MLFMKILRNYRFHRGILLYVISIIQTMAGLKILYLLGPQLNYIQCGSLLWDILSKDYFDILKAYPKYVIRAGYFWITGKGNQQLSNTCYSREAFNKYGDNIYNLDNNYEFSPSDYRILEISDICIDRLNELNKYELIEDLNNWNCIHSYSENVK